MWDGREGMEGKGRDGREGKGRDARSCEAMVVYWDVVRWHECNAKEGMEGEGKVLGT